MTELLTAAQMRAIEAAAIASGEVTGLELMERAGRGVVEAIFEEWPELSPSWGPTPKPPEYLLQDDEKGKHRAVVLCGPGNNGGDGFVVARLLHEAGWGVEVFLYGDAEKLPPDARANYERWMKAGTIATLDTYLARRKWGCDILIDALFGTGLSRPLCGFGDLFWNTSDARDCHVPQFGHPRGRPAIVSIDITSGVCSDSGRAFNLEDCNPNAISAHLTVTFHRAKLGHFLSEGPQYTDRVIVKDIGLTLRPNEVRPVVTISAPYANWLEKGDDHKYKHGHVLLLSGGVGSGGAARLAARGALRIGAGVVTVGCPEAALVENAAQLNAVMLRAIGDSGDLADVLGDERINALCVGPGLGQGDRERELVSIILGEGGVKPRPTVLDADALTLLAADQELLSRLHSDCVLTPHAGEFARLFPDIAEKLNAPSGVGPFYSKVDATRDAARRAGCVVLFKGANTVIADPKGGCSINTSVYDRRAPWLATAGSGDVLAGFIAGIMARQFAPVYAAWMGAWLHTECALKFGPGLIAEDLPEQLPAVFRDLGV